MLNTVTNERENFNLTTLMTLKLNGLNEFQHVAGSHILREKIFAKKSLNLRR